MNYNKTMSEHKGTLYETLTQMRTLASGRLSELNRQLGWAMKTMDAEEYDVHLESKFDELTQAEDDLSQADAMLRDY